MEDITEAANILLFLGKPEAEQFQKRLEEQLYQTSVGSVLEGSDGAFEEVGRWVDSQTDANAAVRLTTT